MAKKEVEESRYSNRMTVAACTAYESHTFEAQEERHVYEDISLRNIPSHAAGASSPTSPVQRSDQNEDLPASSVQEDHNATTSTSLMSTGKSSDDGDCRYETTCTTFSAAISTKTTATPTNNTPTTIPSQDTDCNSDYVDMEYDAQMS